VPLKYDTVFNVDIATRRMLSADYEALLNWANE